MAYRLAASRRVPRLEAIRELGEGWVGEEALAIAIYSAFLHPNDFQAAVLAAVNDGGDTDSTGSICGALMGARLGLGSIPQRWAGVLLHREWVLQIARDMFRTFVLDERVPLAAYPGYRPPPCPSHTRD